MFFLQNSCLLTSKYVCLKKDLVNWICYYLYLFFSFELVCVFKILVKLEDENNQK